MGRGSLGLFKFIRAISTYHNSKFRLTSKGFVWSSFFFLQSADLNFMTEGPKGTTFLHYTQQSTGMKNGLSERCDEVRSEKTSIESYKMSLDRFVYLKERVLSALQALHIDLTVPSFPYFERKAVSCLPSLIISRISLTFSPVLS